MNNYPDNIRCAHVVAGLHPNAGGPSRTVVQLVDALARFGLKISLTSQAYENQLITKPLDQNVTFNVAKTNSSLALMLGLPLRRTLYRSVVQARPMIIHSHGLWTPQNYWAYTAARKLRVPLVVQPRGMLEPWALNHKKLKKYIALKLYEQKLLSSAATIVATAESEYQSIRALGLRNPVAIIPNGVIMTAFEPKEATDSTCRTKNRTLLFLSRVHEKKGLVSLVSALAQLKPVGWRLQIAGPDEGGHLADVMALAQKLNIDNIIEYAGVVDGEEKAALYRSADIFVLPTYSENFGVVVAEALASGLPVITTKGAPWADLVEFKCGWWIDIGEQPLAAALREAMALSDDERHAMGMRGRGYVARYNWDVIAKNTADVYSWVIGQSQKPACVRID